MADGTSFTTLLQVSAPLGSVVPSSWPSPSKSWALPLASLVGSPEGS